MVTTTDWSEEFAQRTEPLRRELLAQPAAAAYYRVDDGAHQALGVAVLDATSARVARITVFPGGPALVATLAYPLPGPR